MVRRKRLYVGQCSMQIGGLMDQFWVQFNTNLQCESCHGDGRKHMFTADTNDIFRLKRGQSSPYLSVDPL
jgi:hypothetical protein